MAVRRHGIDVVLALSLSLLLLAKHSILKWNERPALDDRQQTRVACSPAPREKNENRDVRKHRDVRDDRRFDAPRANVPGSKFRNTGLSFRP